MGIGQTQLNKKFRMPVPPLRMGQPLALDREFSCARGGQSGRRAGCLGSKDQGEKAPNIDRLLKKAAEDGRLSAGEARNLASAGATRQQVLDYS